MSESISSATIPNAILALDAAIARVESIVASGSSTDAELEPQGESLLEIQRSFGGLVAIYKDRRRHDPKLPDLNNILGSRST